MKACGWKECVCKSETVDSRPGLAADLWHGLQLAVLNALTNIQAVEAAFSRYKVVNGLLRPPSLQGEISLWAGETTSDKCIKKLIIQNYFSTS